MWADGMAATRYVGYVEHHMGKPVPIRARNGFRNASRRHTSTLGPVGPCIPTCFGSIRAKGNVIQPPVDTPIRCVFSKIVVAGSACSLTSFYDRGMNLKRFSMATRTASDWRGLHIGETFRSQSFQPRSAPENSKEHTCSTTGMVIRRSSTSTSPSRTTWTNW